jgi:hypothetical protein
MHYAKERARKKGLVFELDLSHFKNQTVCELSGVPLNFTEDIK